MSTVENCTKDARRIQLSIALNIEALAKALLFASRILERHGERMIARTFSSGFRIELRQKDLTWP